MYNGEWEMLTSVRFNEWSGFENLSSWDSPLQSLEVQSHPN